jgi:23S rRNA (guanosine2251-2'-O)-methyltransferase
MQHQKKSMPELQRATTDEVKNIPKIPVCLALDSVRSMNNVGSVFRSADCFSIEKIILGGYTPQPPHKDIHKTALGATDTVAWEHQPNLLDYLIHKKAEGFVIIAIEQTHNSTSLEQYTINKNAKYILVLGNEVFGVEQAIIDQCNAVLEIPQSGSKHSLNISVSAGVVAWQFYKAFL